MTNFEKKANELGLDVNNLSKALNKEVNEYYEGVNELKNLKDSLADADGEEAEKVQEEINELEDVLNDFDDLLVQKIEKYNLNKASYDEKLKKMAEGRERAKLAKQGQTDPQTQSQPQEQQPQPQPQPQNQPQAQPKAQSEPQKTEDESTPKEEKSDWGWLVFAGIVGAVTLGAVWLRKK
jgi:biotin carboxyl carrier protein